MNFPLYIARRYLLSKSSNNAINIITLIATIGVIVSTIALFVVKGSAVNEISHLVFLVFLALAIFGVTVLMTDKVRFGYS